MRLASIHKAWPLHCANSLRVIGWLAVNILAAAGLLTLVFTVLGNFSMQQTMAQLVNIAERYLVASQARQAQLTYFLTDAYAFALCGISFFRRANLIHALEFCKYEPE